MENIKCRVISFKQSSEHEEHVYFLSDRPLETGCYYYNRDLGRFAAVQRCLEQEQLKLTYPRIEASTDVNYELPAVPPIFKEHYFSTGKTQKTAQIRVKL